MDFLDEAMGKAKDFFDIAANKTEQAVQIGKQRCEIAGIKNRLDKSYGALGRICFENFKNDDAVSDEIKAVIAQIKSEREELEAARDHLAAMRAKRICPKCSAAIEDTAVFCHRCGERLIYTDK